MRFYNVLKLQKHTKVHLLVKIYYHSLRYNILSRNVMWCLSRRWCQSSGILYLNFDVKRFEKPFFRCNIQDWLENKNLEWIEFSMNLAFNCNNFVPEFWWQHVKTYFVYISWILRIFRNLRRWRQSSVHWTLLTSSQNVTSTACKSSSLEVSSS